MNQALKYFIPRAPRYILRPSDSQILYFAQKNENGIKHPTRIVNVSTSGIAFLVTKAEAPRIDDHVKIEFPVPGGEQVAWWARVVRIESYSDSRWWSQNDSFDSSHEVLIAVTYVDLPSGHRKDIQQALQNRFHELQKQHRKEYFNDLKDFLLTNFWNFVLFGLCAVAAVLALALFTRYEPLFDVKDGSAYDKLFEGMDF